MPRNSALQVKIEQMGSISLDSASSPRRQASPIKAGMPVCLNSAYSCIYGSRMKLRGITAIDRFASVRFGAVEKSGML